MAPSKVLCLFLTLSVAGCATPTFDPRGCPQERKYTRAEQNKFLNDIGKTPRSIQGMVVDYGKLRDQSRACRGER